MCFRNKYRDDDEAVKPTSADPNKISLNFKLNKEQKRMATEKMLTEMFPTVPYLIVNIIGIFMAFVMIAFQIGLIITKGPLYFIGAGIWAGCIFLVSIVINLTFIKDRTFKHYRITSYGTRIAFIFLILEALVHTVANIGCNKYFQCTTSRFEWFGVIIMISAIISKIVSTLGLVMLTSRIEKAGIVMIAENAILQARRELEQERAKMGVHI